MELTLHSSNSSQTGVSNHQVPPRVYSLQFHFPHCSKHCEAYEEGDWSQISTEDASTINTQLGRNAKTADITEFSFGIIEIVKIIQQNVKEDSSIRYRSPEEAVLYVEYEVVRHLVEKANNEYWMTLAMSCNPCSWTYYVIIAE